MKGQHQVIDKPVIAVVAAHRGRLMSMGDNYSGTSVGAPPTTLGRHGVSQLVNTEKLLDLFPLRGRVRMPGGVA